MQFDDRIYFHIQESWQTFDIKHSDSINLSLINLRLINIYKVDMILSENTRRVRRARVSLTDFLDQEQAAALKAFAGCQTNAITRSCPGDCRSNKYRYENFIAT